jgi:hypothetical protein
MLPKAKISIDIFFLFFLVLLAALYGCDSSSSSSPKTLSVVRGFVYLDEPLIGATIIVEVQQGDENLVLVEQAGTTSETGTFGISCYNLPTTFRIIAKGGTLSGQPFKGEMIARIEDYDGNPDTFYHVNPVSTLMVRYADNHPEMTWAEVDKSVRNFLKIPADVEFINDLDWDSSYVHMGEFMFEAQAAGGFDLFVAQLILEIDWGYTHPFMVIEGVFDIIKVVGDIIKPGLQKLASDAVSKGMSTFFGLIFGCDNNAEKLKEIKDELDVIKADVGEILKIVGVIEKRINNIIKMLNEQDFKDAIDHVNNLGNVITNNFDGVRERAKIFAGKEPTDDDWDWIKAKCGYGGEILNDSTGVKGALKSLTKCITGTDFKGTPLLELHANFMKEKLTFENRMEVLREMEIFFLKLLNIEIRGVYLLVNAYSYRENYNMVEDSLVNFYQKMLKPQVELFLKVVEELVMSRADLMSSEFKPGGVMLAEASAFAKEILNAYHVDNETETISISENPYTLTARIAFIGEAPEPQDLSFKESTTQKYEKVEYVKSSNYSLTDSGVTFSFIRYVVRDVEPGTYLLEHSYPNIHLDYSVTIDEENKHGVVGIPAWGEPDPNREYKIINKNSEKFLEVTGPSDWDGAHIQQWDYNGGWNFWWKEDWSTYGTRYSGKDKVMTVAGASKEEGAKIVQWGLVDAPHQEWTLYVNSFGSHNSDHFLSIENDSLAKGANAVQTYCYLLSQEGDVPICEHDSATWDPEDMGDWYFLLKNQQSGLYLEVAGPTTFERESHLQQYPWADWDSQKWRLEYMGSGHYRLVSKFSSKCLSVWKEEGAPEKALEQDKAPMKQVACGTGNAQLWRLEPVEGGYFRITNKLSDKCLDVDNAEQGKLDGLEVFQMRRDNTTERQKWKLEALSQ